MALASMSNGQRMKAINKGQRQPAVLTNISKNPFWSVGYSGGGPSRQHGERAQGVDQAVHGPAR